MLLAFDQKYVPAVLPSTAAIFTHNNTRHRFSLRRLVFLTKKGVDDDGCSWWCKWSVFLVLRPSFTCCISLLLFGFASTRQEVSKGIYSPLSPHRSPYLTAAVCSTHISVSRQFVVSCVRRPVLLPPSFTHILFIAPPRRVVFAWNKLSPFTSSYMWCSIAVESCTHIYIHTLHRLSFSPNLLVLLSVAC